MFNQTFVDTSYAAIKNGGLSLVKADIGYGLLGNSEASIRKMYKIKGRPFSNPCIIAGNIDILKDIALVKEETLAWIQEISQHTTLAVVLPIHPLSTLLPKLSPWLYQQTTQEGTVAIFLNSGDYINEIVKKAYEDEILLIGSSGNLSQHGNNYAFSEVPESILFQVDYAYDAGLCKYANEQKLATTIVNLAKNHIKRKGVDSELVIQSYQAHAKKMALPLLEGV